MRTLLAALLLLLSAAALSAASPPEHFVHSPHDTQLSPRHTFRIEHYADERMEEDWKWQTWIVQVKNRSVAYPLPHSKQFPANYGAECHVSPSERALLFVQKTGSGDNSAALYTRTPTGRFALRDDDTSLDTLAWQEFDRRSHFATDSWCCRYHSGLEFVRWEKDGRVLVVGLRGRHCDEDYSVSDWRLHYDIGTRRFFLTAGDKRHNAPSLHWKNWRRPGLATSE